MTFSVGEFRALRVVTASRSGRVWSADAPGGTGPVALRRHDPADAAKVEAEFRTAVRGRHPHVLRVLTLATSAEGVALVSEFAVGGSLRDRLAVGPLRPGQVVTLLAALASALAYCHDELAVVHGGVRASRVLFTADGRPLLAGLGAVEAASAVGEMPVVPPGDASPALARGARPTPADDVFALGSVALQALTGRSAWPADEMRDVVVQSAFGQWPEPDADCPDGLARLLRTMLAAEPGERPAATDIFRALADCDEPEPIDVSLRAPEVDSAHVVRDDPAQAPAADVVAVAERAPTVAPTPSLSRRRGGQADGDTDAGTGDAPPPTGALPGGWLDAPDAPSWSLTPDSGPADEGDRPPLAVTPVPSVWPAQRIGRSRPPRPPDRRAGGWRHTAVTTVVALALAVGSVIAGLWWASSDETPGAVLPPVADATAGVASSADPAGTEAAAAATAAASGFDTVDWLAVVSELDARRSEAFAAADAGLLAAVYTPGADALAVDAERIRALAEAGWRVEGLRHAIASVHLARGTELTVEVVDSMPSQPILDESGAVVAHTAEQTSATRILRLVATAGGYRIAEIDSAD